MIDTNHAAFRWDMPLTIPLLEQVTDAMPISVRMAESVLRVGRIILNSTWVEQPTLITLVQFLVDKAFRDNVVHKTRDVAMMLAWTELSELEQLTTRSLESQLRAVVR